mgnify:CR=1 FL=1
MTTRIAVLLLAGMFCASVTHAQEKKAAEKAPAAAEKKVLPQQQRMGNCNKDAKDRKLAGDDRKAFMKDCLGGKTAAAADDKKTPPQQQQQKMAKCNADAKEKKISGADRKTFMSTCLKG